MALLAARFAALGRTVCDPMMQQQAGTALGARAMAAPSSAPPTGKLRWTGSGAGCPEPRVTGSPDVPSTSKLGLEFSRARRIPLAASSRNRRMGHNGTAVGGTSTSSTMGRMWPSGNASRVGASTNDIDATPLPSPASRAGPWRGRYVSITGPGSGRRRLVGGVLSPPFHCPRQAG